MASQQLNSLKSINNIQRNGSLQNLLLAIKQDKMERLDSQQTSLQEAYELQLIDYLIHNW